MAQNTGDINNQFNYEDPTLTNPEGLGSLVRSEEDARREELANLAATRRAYRQSRPNVINTMQDADQMRGRDYTRGDIYLPEEDYGKRNVDKKITDYGSLTNLENARGEAQSALAQVTNGIIKGTVLAGTTFADGVVGSVAGLLNMANQTSEGNVNNFSELGYTFTNNPFSQYMQKINDWSEKAFPNFYTDEERSKTWGTSVFSANFIGDHFIKNLGFMIGAAYSGRVIAGMLSKAAGLNKVRDAYRGLNIVTKDGKKLSEAKQIYDAYKRGDAFVDGVLISDHLANLAKKTKNLEFGLQTFGAITSAMGEGRIEAIQNTQDWYDREKGMIEERTKQAEKNLINDVMFEQNNDGSYKYSRLVYNPETGSAQRQLTNDGLQRVQERLGILKAEYEGALDQIQNSRASMANSIFLMNVGLLSGSNLFSYSRFLSGGFKTGTRYTKMLSEESRSLLSRAIAKGEKITEDIAQANLKPVAKSIAKAAAVPVVEGPWEEMMQQSIATGMGNRESSRLNAYYGYQFDEEAEEEAVNWMNSFLGGIAQTYTDPRQWEQGFIGAISSLAGVPSFHMRVNEAGKKKLSVDFNGELWENIKSAREYRQKAQETADEVNKAIKNDDFINLWRGYIRHKKYDADKSQFLKELDQFEFNNAEIGQIVSDIELFDKAGMLDDLKTIIEQVGNITTTDADEIRKNTTITDIQKGLYDGMTDEEIVDKVKSNAAEFKDFVDQYTKVRDDINTIYGGKVDDEVLRTMTWQTMIINDVEKRTKQLIDEVFPKLNALNTAAQESMSDKPTEFTLDNIQDLNNVVYKKGSKEYSILNELLKSIRDFRTDEITIGQLNQKFREAEDKWKKLGAKQTRKSSSFRALMDAHDRLVEATKLSNIDENVSDTNLDVLNSPELGQLIIKTQDLVRLVAYRNNFLNNLKMLSERPDMFTKEAVAANKEAIARQSKKEAERIYGELSNTDSSYRDAIANMSADTLKEFDKLIDDGDNESLKQQKEALGKYDDVVKRVFNVIKDDMFGENGDTSDLAKSLVGKIRELVDNNNTADEFLESMKDLSEEAFDDGDQATADYLNHLLAEYSTRTKRSGRSKDMVGGKKKPTPSKRDEEKNEAAETQVPDDAEGFTPTFKKRAITQDFDDDGVTIEEELETSSERQETPVELMPEVTPAAEQDDAAKKAENEDILRKNAVDYSDKITSATKKDVDYLKSIINSSLTERRVSPEMIDIIRDMAAQKLLELTNQVDTGAEDGSAEQSKMKIEDASNKGNTDPAAQSAGIDSNDGNGGMSNDEFIKIDSGSLRGWIVTKYDIRQSVNSSRAIYTPDVDKAPQLYELQKFLNEYNVFDFVDSGALGVLNHIYRARGSESGVPVRFVIAQQLHETVNDKDFYTVAMAVEITPEDRSELGVYSRYLKTKEIDGKQYQIIGALKVGGQRGDVRYQEAKNAYNQLYGMIIKDVASQMADNPHNDMYVASGVQSSISTFWNGRMSVEESGNTPGFTSLKDKLNDLKLPYGFSIYIPGASGGMKTFFANRYMQLNGSSIMGPINGANQGSVWLNMIDPGGGVKQIYVRVKRVSEYDFDNGTSFARDMKNQINILVDPNGSFVDKMRAKAKLSRMIYFPKGYVFSFQDKGGVVSLRFGKSGGDAISTAEDFINVLKADDSLRFQVSESQLSTTQKQKDLVDSDILETDYTSLLPFNSSFSISFVTSDGKSANSDIAERGRVKSTRFSGVASVQYNDEMYWYNTETQEVSSGKTGESVDEKTQSIIQSIYYVKNRLVEGESGTMAVAESGVPQRFTLFKFENHMADESDSEGTLYIIKFGNSKETVLNMNDPKDVDIANRAERAIAAFKAQKNAISGDGFTPSIKSSEIAPVTAIPVDPEQRPVETKPKPTKRGKRRVGSGEIKPLFNPQDNPTIVDNVSNFVRQMADAIMEQAGMNEEWGNIFTGMTDADATVEAFKRLGYDVDLTNPVSVNSALTSIAGSQTDMETAVRRVAEELDHKINCG